VADFMKSLTVSRIMDDPGIIVAYQMNGQALPILNGFPARLIVPGWYATYWVKNLSDINVLDHQFDGFWLRKSYLVPDNACGCVPAGTKPAMVPISQMNVRSFIITPQDGTRVAAGRATTLKGIAFDGGYGIHDVTVSADNGATWRSAQLGRDLGNYSFREWSFDWTPPHTGAFRLMARATNRIGQSQPAQAPFNPSGYLHNEIEHVDVTVA